MSKSKQCSEGLKFYRRNFQEPSSLRLHDMKKRTSFAANMD